MISESYAVHCRPSLCRVYKAKLNGKLQSFKSEWIFILEHNEVILGSYSCTLTATKLMRRVFRMFHRHGSYSQRIITRRIRVYRENSCTTGASGFRVELTCRKSAHGFEKKKPILQPPYTAVSEAVDGKMILSMWAQNIESMRFFICYRWKKLNFNAQILHVWCSRSYSFLFQPELFERMHFVYQIISLWNLRVPGSIPKRFCTDFHGVI